MARTARTILQRQLDARRRLWPELTDGLLWIMDKKGWVALPRLMPLMLSIMDDLSGKGVPVSRTYLELWARIRVEESFLMLRPDEMAFHAGFEGQRAVRTWRDRMQRLAELGFISVKPGALGDLTYALVYNPYHVIKRAHLAGKVQDKKWAALMMRANEVSAFDIDDIDDQGNLVTESKGETEADSGAKKPENEPLTVESLRKIDISKVRVRRRRRAK
nr:hypothetical protein [uncultured Dongia sp.]